MNDRILQERIENDYVKEEWQESLAFDIRDLSDQEVARLVRKANQDAKRNGSYVRYRSIEWSES